MTQAEKRRQVWARLWPWLLFFALLAGMAAVRGLTHAFTIDYEITNGDFQNYNPVRRMLTGQAPYDEFTAYLGAGELYSVSAVLLLVGNSFGRSIFASNALTWFYFELLAFAAAYAVLGGGRRARALTLATCGACFGLVQGLPGFGRLPGAAQVAGLLSYASASGNSARMIRSASLPIAVLVLAAGLRLYQDHPPTVNAIDSAQGHKPWFPLKPALLFPLVAGALVPWSNDMGAALYLSLSLAYGLLLIRKYKTHIIYIFVQVVKYVALSVVALGVSVTLVSWGNPIGWLRQTRGTGSYQSWYYGSGQNSKLCYLTDLHLTTATVVMLVAAVVAAVWLFRAKTRRDALSAAGLFTLTLGMALWDLLYCILSTAPVGPAGGAQALLVVLLPPVVVRLVLAALHSEPLPARLKRAALPLCAAFGAVVLAAGAAGQISARAAGRGEGYTYLPALGGWLGDQAAKLATEETIAEGKTVWSTYGSALEAMTGRFQPSGTDYIIHVLGDSQRFRYLQQLQNGDYDLVQTPSFKVTSFERWSRNANWWFYRELYRNWMPVGTTYACGGMHVFWQRGTTGGSLPVGAAVTIDQPSPDTVTLTVRADEPGFNGVADVNLTYAQTVDSSFRQRGGLASFLQVEAVTEKQLCKAAGRESGNCDFFIPTSKITYDIPVTISDGVGVVKLHALPADVATVTVSRAGVTAIYTDWEYFYE